MCICFPLCIPNQCHDLVWISHSDLDRLVPVSWKGLSKFCEINFLFKVRRTQTKHQKLNTSVHFDGYLADTEGE